jgi:GAF domain-containing protein
MLYIEASWGFQGPLGVRPIDVTERDPRLSTAAASQHGSWAALSAWAAELVARIADEQPAQHVSVFVPDANEPGLRLAAQVWGAGEDLGAVVPGDWLVPLHGSVCGRVFRTAAAALVADVAMDPDYRSFPGGRTRSSLTVPVVADGAVVAVINVEAPWVGAFSIRDYERLTEHAAHARAGFPLSIASERGRA